METFFGLKTTISQAWDKSGKRVPVTVISAGPMTVTQVKTETSDGYNAVQVGFGQKSGKYVAKALLTHLKKTPKDTIFRTLKEIRFSKPPEYQVGDVITVDQIFALGDKLAVTGISKGSGFAGGVKRWGFKGGPRTHGQSDRERAPGSIGQGTSPGRIHKGKKMAGHYGHTQFTVENVPVINIDAAHHEIWLSGLIPGFRGSIVTLVKLRPGTFSGLYHDTPVEIKAAGDAKPATPQTENVEAAATLKDSATDTKKAAQPSQPADSKEKEA